MTKPILLVIAGCNGSGKSTFSKDLGAGNFDPFDYDFHFLNNYTSLIDIDIREKMAHNLTRQQLENQVEAAIKCKSNFCYETNFNTSPLYWPQIFKDNGYEIRMTFLCLNSIEEAIKRVSIRVQNGGHFVPESEIKKRYHEGFENLNLYYDFFDSIDLFDTSSYGELPKFALSIEKGNLSYINSIPSYLKELINPKFYS
jgi:predicted ABC-type ATPase